MSLTVDAIKDAISQMSPSDRRELASWFDRFDDEAWVQQMAQDFSPSGRGQRLVDQLDREIDRGEFRPLEEGSSGRKR